MSKSAPPWAIRRRISRAAPEIGNTAHLRRDDIHPDEWFVTVPGDPVAKPRHRSGNGRHYSTARQSAAEALVRRCAVEQNDGRPIMLGPVALMAVFVMPTRHKAMWGQLHAGKPDQDNLMKLLCDGLSGAGVWSDDACVSVAWAVKIYGGNPMTIAQIAPAIVPAWVNAMLTGGDNQ